MSESGDEDGLLSPFSTIPLINSFSYAYIRQFSSDTTEHSGKVSDELSELMKLGIFCSAGDKADEEFLSKHVSRLEGLFSSRLRKEIVRGGKVPLELLSQLCVFLMFDPDTVVDFLERSLLLDPIAKSLGDYISAYPDNFNPTKHDEYYTPAIQAWIHLTRDEDPELHYPEGVLGMVEHLLVMAISIDERDREERVLAVSALTKILKRSEVGGAVYAVTAFVEKWIKNAAMSYYPCQLLLQYAMCATAQLMSAHWEVNSAVVQAVVTHVGLSSFLSRFEVAVGRKKQVEEGQTAAIVARASHAELECCYASLLIAKAVAVAGSTSHRQLLAQAACSSLNRMCRLHAVPRAELLMHAPIVALLFKLVLGGGDGSGGRGSQQQQVQQHEEVVFNPCMLLIVFACQILTLQHQMQQQEEIAQCSGAVELLAGALVCISQLSDAQVIARIEAFLVSVPSQKERTFIQKSCCSCNGPLRSSALTAGADGKEQLRQTIVQCGQAFCARLKEALANETSDNNSSISSSSNNNTSSLSLSHIDDDDDADVDVTLDLDESRVSSKSEEEEIDALESKGHAPPPPAAAAAAAAAAATDDAGSGSAAFLQSENAMLRKSLLLEQRRVRELQSEQARSAHAVAAKDTVLKDTLERLQCALLAQDELQAKEKVAAAWADECEAKYLDTCRELEGARAEVLERQGEVSRTNDLMAATTKNCTREIEAGRAKVASLERSLSDKEAVQVRLEGQVHALESQVSSTESSKHQLEKSLASEQEKVSALEGQVGVLEGQVDALEIQVVDAQAGKHDLEQSLTKEREISAQQRAQIEKAQNKAAKARDEATKARDVLKYINEMSSKLSSETTHEGDGDVENSQNGAVVESESEAPALNDKQRRMSLSIQETITRHLSQEE
jgi:hypothetical protein